MNPRIYDFAIIGGDKRLVCMAENLHSLGYSVILYGLPDSSPILSLYANSLAEAIDSSKVIITPIPVSKDGVHILSQKAESDLTIDNLCKLLSSDQTVYGGCLTELMTDYFKKHRIPFKDFMEQEEITLFNTIATAEGSIAEAISESTTNLHGCSCLILGFGRCARTLAEKLKGLCSKVDITARSSVALAAADASSFGAFSLEELKEQIEHYDYIFNTIPSVVLTKDLLSHTKPGVVIIDIASAPGGVDFEAAKELGRFAKLSLGLPGKYAPKSSAACLTDFLLSDLRKK
ncbi:dipicolinate synthase subunit A [Anaerocolumna cellulosilytica]|uniref:Dipicolinate synthase subunit A n=1 Tax=Anaerocolumna cellulosilytica TaxID=433286 RepID=A0A6S6R6V9_9FIRM|nr:dipicolinate synthase subunit DpsA [Anaerocolumna cellulosilytica]MBB5197958.1 dipicolinate synthase subunit A [Anaerocolumna cellulosilytica]BCJ95162.1 dipicolinate synthase subunit A [Anaerocolumna cellulosilytica]